jgi:hypothetical protein
MTSIKYSIKAFQDKNNDKNLLEKRKPTSE